MPDIHLADIFAEPNGPDPDYPYCPITGHTAYLMDVNDGDITLTCTTCGKKIDPDLLDAFATGCEIPVTVEFHSDPGDGWEFGPEFSGTITPRDGAERLRAERGQLAEKLTVATRTVAEVANQRDGHKGANTILRGLLSEFIDDDPCAYDHHGYCQTHGLSANPCRNARARQLVDAPKTPDEQRPEPHLVTVTHLPGGFDLSDRKPHEQLIGNGVAGWASHLVEHPAACHLLPYGTQCWFDEEWEHGQFTYDDIVPGRYSVLLCHQDVGDHQGEYSHTEDYLDYVRIGDTPALTPAPATVAGYSQEAPF